MIDTNEIRRAREKAGDLSPERFGMHDYPTAHFIALAANQIVAVCDELDLRCEIGEKLRRYAIIAAGDNDELREGILADIDRWDKLATHEQLRERRK